MSFRGASRSRRGRAGDLGTSRPSQRATHAPREAKNAPVPPFDARSIRGPRPAGRTRRPHGHRCTVAVRPYRGRAEASLSTSAPGRRLRHHGRTPADLSRTGAAANLGATDSRFRTEQHALAIARPQHRASAGDLCARDSRFRTGRCGLAVAELSIARRLGCTPRHHRHAPGQRSVGSRRRPPCDWHTDPDLGVGASGCGPQHRAQLCPARNARRTPETRTGVGYALAALATRTMTDRSPDPCARTSRRATGAPHGCAVASGNVIWPP